MKHGQRRRNYRSQEYIAWVNMKDRCYNKAHKRYADYGGRGITVCQRWLNSFQNFFDDMGKKPSSQHSIDRYPNNNGNYSPDNCRWATKREQNLNQRARIPITHNGETKSSTEWAKVFGVCSETILRRFRRGVNISKHTRTTEADSSNADGKING